MHNSKPWFHKGLRFQCSGCGDCCTGAPGYVWVNKAEIEAAAAALRLDVRTFERKYARLVGIRKSLLELPGGDCTLFDPKTRACRIYQVRPRQCRTWPFWVSNLRSEDTWAETALACPGCNLGPLFSLPSIRSQLKVLRV